MATSELSTCLLSCLAEVHQRGIAHSFGRAVEDSHDAEPGWAERARALRVRLIHLLRDLITTSRNNTTSRGDYLLQRQTSR